MAVTLLLDTLGSEDASGLSQVDACAVYTLACLGVTYGMQDRRYCFFQLVYCSTTASLSRFLCVLLPIHFSTPLLLYTFFTRLSIRSFCRYVIWSVL